MFTPFVIKNQKDEGGLQESSLIVIIIIFFFSFFFIVLSLSRRRRVKRRRVRVRGTGVTVKAIGEATKAHVSVPLLHRVLRVKMSHPLFKRFNFHALFTLGGNG
jgi:hypothetical protein